MQMFECVCIMRLKSETGKKLTDRYKALCLIVSHICLFSY